MSNQIDLTNIATQVPNRVDVNVFYWKKSAVNANSEVRVTVRFIHTVKAMSPDGMKVDLIPILYRKIRATQKATKGKKRVSREIWQKRMLERDMIRQVINRKHLHYKQTKEFYYFDLVKTWPATQFPLILIDMRQIFCDGKKTKKFFPYRKRYKMKEARRLYTALVSEFGFTPLVNPT
jgi:hypothetical protein